jgi:hypothetical protein
MTHVIRIKDETFEELTRRGKWQDTMDNIISRVLKQAATSKKGSNKEEYRK